MADIDAYCREQTGMGETWSVFRHEHVGSTPTGKTTHFRFTGNQIAAYGDQRLCGRKWSKDPTTERVVVVSYVDFDAWVKRKDGEG
jgi:hypothetical protein